MTTYEVSIKTRDGAAASSRRESPCGLNAIYEFAHDLGLSVDNIVESHAIPVVEDRV